MNKSLYESMVDYVWDEELSDNERSKLIEQITRYPSFFKIDHYTPSMRRKIRSKLVEWGFVMKLEDM